MSSLLDEGRSDFEFIAQELGADYDLPVDVVERIEQALREAFAAGQAQVGQG